MRNVFGFKNKILVMDMTKSCDRTLRQMDQADCGHDARPQNIAPCLAYRLCSFAKYSI